MRRAISASNELGIAGGFPMPNKVLAVDDDQHFTNMLKMNLERTGEFEVKVVNDPTKALETAHLFKPQVILLDIIMPKLDGGDVLLLFRQDPELHKVPVIMLTALLSDGDEENWKTDDADQEMSFLSKPVDMDVLVGSIRKALV
jgi:CheY-like chemotaxis protein